MRAAPAVPMVAEVVVRLAAPEAAALIRAIERARPDIERAGHSLDVKRLFALANGLAAALAGRDWAGEVEP